MSAAIDANVLLYASDERGSRHLIARELLERLARGPSLVYVFWPVAMAYLRIATHPGVFERPLDPGVARANLDALLGRAHVRSPGEHTGFWRIYQGVTTIWTADKDFRRFPDITARDPYAG